MIFSNCSENSIFPVFQTTTEGPFHFFLAVLYFMFSFQLQICYPPSMTAQIIEFPARPAPSISMPLPAIDAWLDEIDAEGADIPPLRAQMLLARCPDPAHEVAIWLSAQIPPCARITIDAS